MGMAQDDEPSSSIPSVTYRDTMWMEEAACRNRPIEEFYDEVTLGKRICTSCPVKTDCLDYSLIHEEYGVWGGLTENQRTRRYPRHIREMMREDYSLSHQ